MRELLDEFAEVGRRRVEEREEGLDEVGCGDVGLAVLGDLCAERGEFQRVVAEESGCAVEHSLVGDLACLVLRSGRRGSGSQVQVLNRGERCWGRLPNRSWSRLSRPGELASKRPRRHGLRALDSHLPLVRQLVSAQGLRARHGQGVCIWIAPSSGSSPFSLRLIRRSVVERRQIDMPGISPCILCQPARVRFKLVRLEINQRLEHDKLLIQALLVQAEKVVLAKVLLQRVVVDEVLVIPALAQPVADVAPLMLVPAVRVQLVVAVEPRLAEPALRMPLEPALVFCAGRVVALALVLAQLVLREQLVLVRKHFFIPRTQITAQSAPPFYSSE